MDLARVDSAAENAFIFNNTPIDAWIGASDTTTEGAWRWSNNNEQFWSGGAGGSTVSGRYANWKFGQPDNWFNQDCGAMELFASGKWADRACSELLEFVCERPLSVGEAEVSCALGGALEDAPWPGFRRCPTHQGTTPLIGAQGAEPYLTYETGGDVESSPAIAEDGTIYVGSYDGYLYALSPSLSLLWRYQTLSMIRSSPAIGPDGTIYVGSNDGRVYAINPNNTLKWSYPTLSPVRASPAVSADGARVYVGSDNGRFYALNSTTGTKLWQVDTLAAVRSSAAISPDGTIYVGLEDWQAIARNPDGTEKWSYPTLGPVTSSPAIGPDGTVYVGCYDGFLYALHPGSGTLKWSYNVGSPITSSPAIASDGVIVFGSDDAFVRALNPDGTLKWDYETGGVITSSPAIGADGIVYIGSRDTFIYALDLDDGAVVWTRGTDGEVESSPAIGADGKVYVGSDDDQLYAIGPGCSPSRPCGNATGPCSTDADCETGLACGFGVGGRFGLDPAMGVCWDAGDCARLDPAECGDPGDLCGADCCVPNCGAEGTPDGCDHDCPACVPGADTDHDSILDCDEQNDGDEWTNSVVFNGVDASQGNSCHVSPTCSAIDSRSEISACFAAQESQLLASGWDFTTTDRDLCDAGFGFQPPWSECREDFAVRYQGSVRLAGSGRHCFQLRGSTTNQCASLFIGTTTITTGAPVCVNLTDGIYGIEWFYETTHSGTNELHVEHCFGADTDCVPTQALDPSDLLPPGSVPSCAPNCPSDKCGNGVLDLGEACDTGLTAFCSPDCLRTADPTPCNSYTECPPGQSCGNENGAELGQLPAMSYCWPTEPCATNPSAACGTPGSACGDCQCTPDCEKQCGDDSDDSCGGQCFGFCKGRETGCQRDSDCAYRHRCAIGEGPRYGQPAGTNVCVPIECDDPLAARTDCGTINDLCGVCPEEKVATVDQGCSGGCSSDQHCGAGGACFANGAFAEFGDLPTGVPDLSAVPSASEVGTLPGAVSAAENGAAQYSIPIEVPPGRAGMEPRLALQYDGSSGESFVARGWSITGIPAITRCARLFAQDPTNFRGVHRDQEDAFCYGSQRLVPISGANGGHGTEYRTEFDSFVKIVSYDDLGAGSPERFTVWTREGRMTTFGLRAEARRSVEGTPVVWYADHVEDHSGNTMDVWYQDLSNDWTFASENRVRSITYGGATGDTGREVRFVYDNTSFGLFYPRRALAGGAFAISSPLNAIETYVDGGRVRSYRFETRRLPTGVPGKLSQEWLLDAVRLCVPDASSGEKCLPPTTFEYGEDPGSLPETTISDALAVVPNEGHLATFGAIALDFNGDGADDLWYKSPTGPSINDFTWMLRLSRGNPVGNQAFFDPFQPALTPVETGSTIHSELRDCKSFQVIDFNQDGRDDLLATCVYDRDLSVLPISAGATVEPPVEDGDYLWYLMLSDSGAGGEGFRTIHLAHDPTPFPAKPPVAYLTDWDGDGLRDFVTCATRENPGGFFPWLNELTWRRSLGFGALGPVESIPNPMHASLGCPKWITDRDGDGIADFTNEVSAERANDRGSRLVDVNGDGLQDVVAVAPVISASAFDPNAPPGNAWLQGPTVLRLDLNIGDFQQGSRPGFRQYNYSGILPNSYHTGTAGSVQGEQDCSAQALQEAFVMDRDGDGRQELYMAPTLTDSSANSGDTFWIKHVPLDEFGAWTFEDSDIPYLPSRTARCYNFRQQPVVMDVNGDGIRDLAMRGGDEMHPTLQIRLGVGGRTFRLLTAVTNGLGVRTDIEYDEDAAGQPVYHPGTLSSGHVASRVLKRTSYPVVSAVTVRGSGGPYADPSAPAPTEHATRSEYEYFDARVDVRGRGSLGFGERIERHLVERDGAWSPVSTLRETTDHVTYNSAIRAFAFAGRSAVVTDTRIVAASALSGGLDTTREARLSNSWAVHFTLSGRPFVALNGRTRTTSDILVDHSPVLVTGSTEYFEAYDGVGNVVASTIQWSDAASIRTELEYAYETDDDGASLTDNWLISLPSRVHVQARSCIGCAAKVREMQFDYDARGLAYVTRRLGAAAGEALALRETVTTIYDGFGNLENTTSVASGLLSNEPARSTEITYDHQSFFPIAIANNVHQLLSMPPTRVLYDPRNGEERLRQEPTGDWTATFVDGFGRTVEARDSAGRITTIAYDVGSQAGGPMQVRTESTGEPTETVEFNAFGSPILERKLVQASTEIRRELAYDSLERLITIGVPYLTGQAPPGAATRSYDNFGRIVREEYPWEWTETPWSEDGAPRLGVIEHEYASIAHVGVSPRVAGLISSDDKREVHLVRDDADFETIEVSGERETSLTVINGLNQAAEYQYGPFDHLERVTFGGVVHTQMSDELGRVTEEEDPDRGATLLIRNGYGELVGMLHNGVDAPTLYTYDALGRRKSATTPDGDYQWEWDGDGADVSQVGRLVAESVASPTIGNSRTEYEYHGPGGEISGIRRLVGGEWFETTTEYNEAALPETITYPTPTGAPFVARYSYNALGRVTSIHDETENHLLWQLGEVDAFEGVSAATYGNGLNVERRREARTGLLHRATAALTGGAAVQDEAYAYESRGLLSIRDDHARSTPLEQDFVHDALRRLRFHVTSDSGELWSYDYDARGNPTLNPIVGSLSYTDPGRPHAVKSTGDGRTFDYDPVTGNQVLRTGPDGRQEIDYTAFDMPKELRDGPHDSPTRVTRFEYDAGGRRTHRGITGGDQITYVGDLYRQTYIASTGLTERRAIVPLPDGGSIEVDIDQSTVADRYHYQHTDYLGSVIAITDGVGAVVERRAYSPFGKPEQSWSTSARSGYTGHEHDSDAGLINMRGRMYDPAIGRFLSADPAGRLVSNAQGLNPLSYVLNSPLAMVDPAGFEEEPLPQSGPDIVVIGHRSGEYAAPDGIRGAGAVSVASPEAGNGGGAMEAHPVQPSAGGDALVELARGVSTGADEAVIAIGMEGAATGAAEIVGGLVVAPLIDAAAPALGRLAAATIKTAAGAAGAIKGAVGKAAASVASAAKSALTEVASAAAKGAEAAKRAASRAGTETVQRAMSRAELKAMQETGLVRGGREGTHFVSDAVNSTATRAQSRLALPTRPEVRVTMEVPAGKFSAPSRVQPLDTGGGRVLPGGGMERTATGSIPARVLRVDPL